ncbi:MAG: type II and III secretion system protein [Ignavibacteriae bacterium]|nr:type II and III secretion system protein [Ignavibacteriota bacterium]
MNITKTSFIILVLSFSFLGAQTKTENITDTSQSKFLNYSEETSFCNFIDYVDFLYQKYENKTIVIKTDCRFPIKIDLNKVIYTKALRSVCDYNNLEIISSQKEIIISKKENEDEQKVNELEKILDSRQVKISATMFEANLDKMNENGVDWSFHLSKHGMQGQGGFNSLNEEEGNFSIRIAGDFYKFSGYTSAMFKLFESHNLGKVISKMSITVRDGETGRMQVGSDISVKQLDFAGNVTDAFFPTGTIIKVNPKVYRKDSLDFALLKIYVERSIPQPGELSTEIKKTLTNTEVILRNNDETIIGSLLLEENFTIREGVPVLKDLPWWVLGIRYLTGYNSKISLHKEVVMLIKAEIIPHVISDKLNKTDLIQENLYYTSDELKKLNDTKEVELKSDKAN